MRHCEHSASIHASFCTDEQPRVERQALGHCLVFTFTYLLPPSSLTLLPDSTLLPANKPLFVLLETWRVQTRLLEVAQDSSNVLVCSKTRMDLLDDIIFLCTQYIVQVKQRIIIKTFGRHVLYMFMKWNKILFKRSLQAFKALAKDQKESNQYYTFIHCMSWLPYTYIDR